MIIYSNGCSHTAGHCVSFTSTWPNMIIRDILNSNDYEINPSINKIKNINVLFNESNFGVGNDYIFHQSLETISKLIQNNKKPDYVFIQWSGPNRRQHCLPTGEILYVNLFDNTEYDIKFEPMGSMHTLHYIFAMQEYLKKNNINYCFLNYMSLCKSIKKLNIYNEIDIDKFIFIEFDKNILFNGLMNYMKNNNMTCDKDGHPNERGNFMMANEILKKMKLDKTYNNKFC